MRLKLRACWCRLAVARRHGCRSEPIRMHPWRALAPLWTGQGRHHGVGQEQSHLTGKFGRAQACLDCCHQKHVHFERSATPLRLWDCERSCCRACAQLTGSKGMPCLLLEKLCADLCPACCLLSHAPLAAASSMPMVRPAQLLSRSGVAEICMAPRTHVLLGLCCMCYKRDLCCMCVFVAALP